MKRGLTLPQPATSNWDETTAAVSKILVSMVANHLIIHV
jgi:hypothetical protein